MKQTKNRTRGTGRRKAAPASGKLAREHKRPLPGITARAHRVRDALTDLFKIELKRNRFRVKPLSEKQLKALAAAQLQSLQSNFRRFLPRYEELAATSRSPRRHFVKAWVECKAVLAQPEMVWLRTYMTTEKRGRPAQRGSLWAILLIAASFRGSKDLNALHANVEDPGKVQAWALGNTEGPELSGVYEAMKSMCGRRDPRAGWHANVAMLRRMSELRTKKGKLLHPDLCVYTAVDGTTLEGDIQQRAFKNGHDRAQVLGKTRARMAFLIYTDSQGNVTKAVAGYKLIFICCIKSTLPIIGGLYPATYDERRAALELVEELRELWPTCPIRFLAGDALFDRSKTLAYELEFTHGIHPVFVDYPVFSKHSEHYKTKGTPKCKHGEMHRAKTYFVHDTKWRSRHDQPLSGSVADGEVIDAGKPATDNAHTVWTCDKGCDSTKTYFRDDIRLYQFLPRSGDSDAAALRQALLLRRGAVESINASLKYLGLGASAQGRIKWGGDVEVDWAFSLACAYMTGRRLAHESGDYQRSYDEAVALGLLEPSKRKDGTASPAPARQDAFSAGALGGGVTIGDEGLSLISWQRAEEAREAEDTDEPIALDDWRRVREDPEAREALIALGQHGLPLPGGPGWEPGDEDEVTDAELLALVSGGHPDDDADAPASWEELDNDEDTPLDPAGLTEKEYIKAHGNVDVTDLVERFEFDVENDGDAAAWMEELGVDEDLTVPEVDAA